MPRLLYLTAVFTLACLIYGMTSAQTSRRGVADTAPEQRALTSGHQDSKGQNSQQLRSNFVPLSILSDSLWTRLHNDFTLSNISNERVEQQISFLQSGISSLETNLKAATPYLFHIVDQLESAEIPLDIALLPLIESAFNPTALSSKSAVGIWQFIPSTARHYGLAVNKNIDERLDVVASTNAAIRYLKDLQQTFDGDWLLALAAYNTGPRNVQKAMDRASNSGAEPSYWNLQLSAETSKYIPRLIAATKIVSSADKFGLKLPPIADQRYFESISVDRRISLYHVAELTSASFEEISALNTGLPNGMTPIFGPHRLVVPVSIAKQLRNRLARMHTLPLADRQTQLELARRNISSPMTVATDITSVKLLDKQSYSSSLSSYFETHTVRHGDTLWGLSRKVGVNIGTLRSWNNLAIDEPIRAGDNLKIAFINNDEPGLMNYRVTPSDSLNSIATKFDLAINDIKKWNSAVRNENYIQAGQLLKIPTYPPTAGVHAP